MAVHGSPPDRPTLASTPLDDGSTLFTPPRVWSFFFFLAAIVFSPFWLEGKMLVVSTDNYFYILPNLLIGRDFLLQGEIWPWSRHLLAGVDFSASNYNFMYSPVYWLMYLFPERYFFVGFTLVNFALVWVAGVAAFYFLLEETGHRWGAALGAVAYQIGGHLFFSLNTYPYFVGYALSMVVLYLLWTMHKRRWALSFLYLAAAIGSLLLSCHVVRAFMLMVLICLCALYRLWPERWSLRSVFSRPRLVFAGALVCALLISAIRLVPLMTDIEGSDRLVKVPFWQLTSSINSIYYAVNAFLPEIFPIRQPQPTELKDGLATSYVYVLGYLGVISALLAIYGALRTRRHYLFWSVFLVCAVLFNIRFKPVYDFILMLLHPAFHAFCLRILTPVPFVVMLAYGAKRLTEDLDRRHGWWLALVTGSVLTMAALAFLMGYDKSLAAVRMLLLCGLGALTVAALLYDQPKRFSGLALALPAAASLGLLLAFLYLPQGRGLLQNSQTSYVATQFVAAIAALAWLSLSLAGLPRFPRLGLGLAGAALLAGLGVAFLLPTPSGYSRFDPETARQFLGLGALRMVLLMAVFAQLLFMLCRRRLAVRTAFLLLLGVLVVDLVGHGRVHADVVIQSFWEPAKLEYPRVLQGRFRSLVEPMDMASQRNHAINGDFEYWVGRQPLGWFPGHLAKLERAGEGQALTGRAALRVVTTQPGAAAAMDVFPPEAQSGGNLLVDGRFADKASLGRHWKWVDLLTVAQTPAGPEGLLAVELVSKAPKVSLHQDMSVSTQKSSLSASAWVKCGQAELVRLYLTTKTQGAYSVYHTGSGEWELLTVRLPLSEPGKNIYVQFNVMFDAPGACRVAEASVRAGAKAPLPPSLSPNQDGPPLVPDRMAAMGAWVKTDQPDAVRLMAGTRTTTAYSSPHSGSGQWEWLTVKHLFLQRSGQEEPPILRVHVWTDKPAEALVDGVVVHNGPYPIPFLGHDPQAIPPGLAPKVNHQEVLPLDLKNYRLPQPSTFMEIGHKYHYTHIPYYYGIPSFGGVNGFRSRYLLTLMDHFTGKDEAKDLGGARYEYLNSPRFNDLMGCGYDVVNGQIVRRPGALARFMLFHEARVIADDAELLRQLDSPDFQPGQTLLISSAPAGLPALPEGGRPAEMVQYQQVRSGEIRLRVQSDQEAVLLFNDSYNSGWSAAVDGLPQTPVRANENFMAIGVPSGEHEVVFRFRPSNWLPRAAGTLAGLLGLAAGTLGLLRLGSPAGGAPARRRED